MGAFEVAVRYSFTNLTDGNVQGRRLRMLMTGVNWYLRPQLKWVFDYGFGRVYGGPLDGNMNNFQTRLGVDFSNETPARSGHPGRRVTESAVDWRGIVGASDSRGGLLDGVEISPGGEELPRSPRRNRFFSSTASGTRRGAGEPRSQRPLASGPHWTRNRPDPFPALTSRPKSSNASTRPGRRASSSFRQRSRGSRRTSPGWTSRGTRPSAPGRLSTSCRSSRSCSRPSPPSEKGFRFELLQSMSYAGMSGATTGATSLGFYSFDSWRSGRSSGTGPPAPRAGSARRSRRKRASARPGKHQNAQTSLRTVREPDGNLVHNGFWIPELAWQQSLKNGEIVLLAGMVSRGTTSTRTPTPTRPAASLKLGAHRHDGDAAAQLRSSG